jgi:hypothetical protein
MLGNNPTDQFAVLLYAVDSLLCGLTFYAFRSYAGREKLFEDADSTSLGPRRSIPGIAIYGLSIPLAFVDIYLALLCFLVVPLLYFGTMMNQRSTNRPNSVYAARERVAGASFTSTSVSGVDSFYSELFQLQPLRNRNGKTTPSSKT